ncbi:MAG: hypothetical protein J3R72DRAFT_455116 [Linnemannia gamsii]|nr:MAG: hypothetical protein J3R72DRAFT_455116 [Linnemannia gamsii]
MDNNNNTNHDKLPQHNTPLRLVDDPSTSQQLHQHNLNFASHSHLQDNRIPFTGRVPIQQYHNQSFVYPPISPVQQQAYLLQSAYTPVPRHTLSGRLLSPSPSPLLSPSPHFDVATRAWSAIPETAMSRQQQKGKARQIVPAIGPLHSGRLPTRSRSTPSPSTAPLETVQSSSSAGQRASSFWIQEGMDTFFDWLTDPHNYARLQKKNPISGQRQSDLHKEICRLVNNKHSTSWTEAQVKAKITYAKSKYREAAALNSTGEGPILHKQEVICPMFVRLHTVLGGSLSANSPPPRQTGGRGEDLVSSDDSEEDTSDVEVPTNTTGTTSHADASTGGHHDSERPSKRRKKERLTPAVLSSSIDRMQLLADQAKAELRSREQAVESRERELTEKLLRIADEASKRADEARAQLRLELAAERAEFKKEMAEFKASERAEIKQEREDLNRDKLNFANERTKLIAEVAALKRELEVSPKVSINKSP